MGKNIKTDDGVTGHNERLQEIADMTFGNLSDDEVLRLLAERKRLEELRREYEKLQKEEEERRLIEQKEAEQAKAAKEKKEALAKAIETLNRSISPDKADDELLKLVAERKALEKELEQAEAGISQPSSTETEAGSADISETETATDNLHPNDEKASEGTASQGTIVPDRSESGFRSSLKQEFGSEGIVEDDFREGSELRRYLDQLRSNTGSLGTLLQEMPIAAKSDKAFMLKVAEIDSAYAMHYAADTLKKDEDFNVRIAAMKNQRNSGNAIAEMLPEARTSKVILSAVKQDYRNIKFVQPNMEAYDEMMSIAKKAALEKIRELKDAADMMLFIPRPLQQDKRFMEEAERVVVGGKKES